MFVDEEELREQLRRREQENQPPPQSTEPLPFEGISGHSIATVLSVAFAVVGVICLIAGCSLASERYDFDWISFCGGLIASMFCFGWAVVMRVCAIYMKLHNN